METFTKIWRYIQCYHNIGLSIETVACNNHGHVDYLSMCILMFKLAMNYFKTLPIAECGTGWNSNN